MISIYLQENTVSPGQLLQGTCQWLPEGNEVNKKAHLKIGWRTEGRGNVDRETLYKKDVVSQDAMPFQYQIPLKVPYSYDGELLRIIWEVTVEVEGPFQLRQAHQTETFRVLPPRSLVS
jgi:hypothetical protein